LLTEEVSVAFFQPCLLDRMLSKCAQMLFSSSGCGVGPEWSFHISAGVQWDNCLMVDSKWDLTEGGMSWGTTTASPNWSVLSWLLV